MAECNSGFTPFSLKKKTKNIYSNNLNGVKAEGKSSILLFDVRVNVVLNLCFAKSIICV